MQKIIFLHGAIAGSYQFDNIIHKLNDEYKIYTLNFPGHAGETMPEDFSIKLFAESVLQYLDNENIDKISIVGHSLGGYVAIYLAKYHSSRIEKIMTIGTKYLWDLESAKNETKLLNPEKIQEKIPKFAEFLAKVHSPNDWKTVLNKTAEFLIQLSTHPDLSLEDFKSIEHEISIVVGDKDSTANLEDTVLSFRQFPNSNLYVMPNTYHPIEKIDIDSIIYHIRKFFK